MQSISITKPDDWHVHLRDSTFLQTTVPATARQFGRAIVMPNLPDPIITAAMAADYRTRINQYIPPDCHFTPLMTLYLTDETTPATIKQASQTGFIPACKLYPAGATTNSAKGVTQIEKIFPALDMMQQTGMRLLIHGEVTDESIDIFDREKIFIDQVLHPLRVQFPALNIVLEHITTQDAVNYINSETGPVAATITIHHLLFNRNSLLVGGVKPHFYCLPILKRAQHQQALIQAAISGNPRFFLGTDSAPHLQTSKETACGCAGIFSAHSALELYTEFFEQHRALDKLEAFSSFYGADFYGLPRHQEKITLTKTQWDIPEKLSYGDGWLIPLNAGKTVSWKIQTHT